MRSFIAILSTAAAAISIPSTHAFIAPTTSVVGAGLSGPERCRSTSSSIQLSAIKLPSRDVSDITSSSSSLQKSVTATLAAVSILLGTASSAFAVSGGGLDYAGLNLSEQNFSSGSECTTCIRYAMLLIISLQQHAVYIFNCHPFNVISIS